MVLLSKLVLGTVASLLLMNGGVAVTLANRGEVDHLAALVALVIGVVAGPLLFKVVFTKL